MSTKVLQLHKRDSYEYKNIQDKYAINSARNIFALADGTTQSYYSEEWAQLLVSSFIQYPTYNTNELISNFTKCVETYKNVKFDISDNPAKASLLKEKKKGGATSTFIGAQILEDNKINVISCGDSNLFVIDSKNKIESFPFKNIEILDANNYFLNSERLLKNEVDNLFFRQKIINYNSGDKIILATDALSRLILKKPEILEELFLINDFDSLLSFCQKYWKNKELEEDDISLILYNNDGKNETNVIIPHKDFTFPKQVEKEFVPVKLTDNTERLIDMNMSEIINQFNGVANDFKLVKNRLKRHEILFLIIIFLLIVNLFFTLRFKPKTINEDDKSSVKTEQVNKK